MRDRKRKLSHEGRVLYGKGICREREKKSRALLKSMWAGFSARAGFLQSVLKTFLYGSFLSIAEKQNGKEQSFCFFQQFFRDDSSNQVKGVGTVSQGNQEKPRTVSGLSAPQDARGTDSRTELERLMEQYGSSLLRMSALYLKDAHLAQDAVQETFIKAYRHMKDYRGESSEKTWLTAICVNTCRDILKTAWFRHQSRIDVDSLPEKPADFEFPDNTVLTEVMRLPARYREAVLIRYYGGMKLKEAASALGISEGRLRTRLDKANGILRDRLKEWYYDEE